MKKQYFKYITALLLFGSNGIVAGNIHISSYEIVFWRTMLGSILLILILFFSKQKLQLMNNKKDCLFISLSGIAMGASWIFLYEAYEQIGVSLASLAYYCGPVIVMILSPVVFGEKLTAVKVTGFLTVIIGIFLVNGGISDAGLHKQGLVCGILSAVMYSLMVIMNKKAVNVKGLENSAIQLFVSFVTVAFFVGIKTGFTLEISRPDWIWTIILGLVNTGMGCYFYFSSIAYLPVQTVAILGYLEPLSAVILAVVILGESLLPVQIIGAALIIGGAILGEMLGKTLKNS